MTRKAGNKSVNSLWIFCEGKTERNYFAQLKAVERIRGLQIRPVTCEDKNIVGLVNYSIKYIEHNRDFLEGDSVVYVFDRDRNTNEDFKKAKENVNDPDLQLILSNPCFEFWILSHFEFYYEPMQPELLKVKLRKYMGLYKKSDPNIYNNTKEKIETAIKNSKKVHKVHINKKVEILCEESNPSTMIFQLIELIKQYKV
jgi:hypothetical protein